MNFCVRVPKGTSVATLETNALANTADITKALNFYKHLLEEAGIDTTTFASFAVGDDLIASDECKMPENEEDRRLGSVNYDSYMLTYFFELEADAATAQEVYHATHGIPYYITGLQLSGYKTTILGGLAEKAMKAVCHSTCATCLDATTGGCVTCKTGFKFWRNNDNDYGRCVPGDDGRSEEVITY